jgi:PBSX family phage terminase large subunit
MANFINKNLVHLIQCYRKGTRGVALEGSSRSGKTIAGIDFITWLSANTTEKFTLNIIRQTQASFKTTLYDDFTQRLPKFGIPSPFDGKKEVNMFWILGNKVNLLGADNPSKFEGATCDFAFYNEMLDIDQVIFDQQEQRCRKMWWGDWNPKMTDHWVFNKILRRPDVSYLHSTFSDNPFISEFEKRKILSYEPTPENIANGTADDYRWNVYGKGVRCVPEGLIFPNVTWIDEFPQEIEREFYGLDFGYTNDPSALVKCGVNGHNVYFKKLIYTPTENADILGELLEKTMGKDKICWADSADPGMISDLRRQGFKIFAAKKFSGCIIYRNDIIKRYKIHIVRDPDFKKEQENYRYRMINGIKLNEPIDGYDHLFSGCGYACQHELRAR